MPIFHSIIVADTYAPLSRARQRRLAFHSIVVKPRPALIRASARTRDNLARTHARIRPTPNIHNANQFTEAPMEDPRHYTPCDYYTRQRQYLVAIYRHLLVRRSRIVRASASSRSKSKRDLANCNCGGSSYTRLRDNTT